MAQQEIIWNYETAKEFIEFWGHTQKQSSLSTFAKSHYDKNWKQ